MDTIFAIYPLGTICPRSGLSALHNDPVRSTMAIFHFYFVLIYKVSITESRFKVGDDKSS